MHTHSIQDQTDISMTREGWSLQTLYSEIIGGAFFESRVSSRTNKLKCCLLFLWPLPEFSSAKLSCSTSSSNHHYGWSRISRDQFHVIRGYSHRYPLPLLWGDGSIFLAAVKHNKFYGTNKFSVLAKR